jgi:hypothetical protein
MNKIGPKNAVTEADKNEEAMIIRNFRRERFTPRLEAY